jgi:hypothetical protein
MHTILKNICLLLSLLLLPCTQSKAYISFLSLWTNGNKKVAVIGDAHKANSIDAEHKDIIVPFFEQLSEKDEKIEVIIEAGHHSSIRTFNPTDNNFTKFNDYSYVRFLQWVEDFARHHKFHYGSLSFSLSDLRFNFDSFASLFGKSPSKNSCNIISDINLVLDALTVFKEDLPTEKAKKICNELEEDIKVYKDNLISLQKTYKEQNIVTCITKASRDTSSKKADEAYVDPIDYAIADAGFIMDTVKSQTNYNTTLIFTGSNHSVVVDTMLEALGYKRVVPHLGKILKNESPYPIDIKEVEQFLQSTIRGS